MDNEGKYRRLTADFCENVGLLREIMRVDKSFDLIERRLEASGVELCFFYVDGFIKDGETLRIMQGLIAEQSITTAEDLMRRIPYVEVESETHIDRVVRGVLSGQCALLAESFGGVAIMMDLRTYPARQTAEPDSDRVMQGSHDGFVETLVTNTALIRRRIRDVRLTMEHYSLGGSSDTDVVVCYMDGIADRETLSSVREKLAKIKPRSLTLGFQSLAETLIRSGWYNPFPKIRTTERPDTAAAQLLEGSVIVLCDTSPLAMILPTSIFDYLEETGDYYFPPITGTYLRLVRTVILLLSVVITPLWYLALEYASYLPESLLFILPESPGALPIILQLFLVEIAVDGLKIASMNTPDILSNSLSVVGALILGDFAVEVGWLCGDVILYMAFVAIANFAQQNYELGYAFKFMRIIILTLVWAFGVWGFALGLVLFCTLVATNKTLSDRHRYLYPLIPFDAKALGKLIIRQRKRDFDDV